MTFKRFNLLIIIQIVFITITNLVIVWAFNRDYLQVTRLYFVVVLIIQIWYLFHSINRNNKTVLQFLEVLKYKFNTNKLSIESNQSSAKDARKLLNEIVDSFGQIKIEKEAEYQYFSNIIKYVNVGLITFDNSGKVELINEVAKSLLQIKRAANISAFNKIYPGFSKHLQDVSPDKSSLLKIQLKDEILNLSISAVYFSIKGNPIKLISLKNIKSELQQEEIETWKKLISVLTHEIMNSVSPITSLSSTLIDTFHEEVSLGSENLDQETKDSILLGLQAVQKRANGLSKFVETYRSLIKIPQPNFITFSINKFLNEIGLLMKEEVEGLNIKLKILNAETDLNLLADEKLLSQVIINLIRNAVQSLNNKKMGLIELRSYIDTTNRPIIEIKDNGIGIQADQLDKVFIPFYTTKVDGSGVGLSLSRQIMNLHKGQIDIKSKYKEGTTVILTF